MNGNTEEETNFLNDLLAGIDADEILNAVPTPVTTPAKKRQRPKSPIKSPEKENWSAQDLDNVGWEWDIDEDDFLTPIKRKKTVPLSPKKTIAAPFPVHHSPPQKSWSIESVTRCVVLSVQQTNTFQKHLAVSLASDPSDARTVILADDWSYTPIAAGKSPSVVCLTRG
ncbi:hypothetical protein BDV98DRAFT_306832 [Pterulicium gracile]|uniref:Uncharacterized protein n=1 Tax=Pterulicium gracile TaxID=1884261 RepID=A0A5C3Q313_9AGAR|nr:hypothetical protein BDV98DRAFT_306832 [Pterula gracilis]